MSNYSNHPDVRKVDNYLWVVTTADGEVSVGDNFRGGWDVYRNDDTTQGLGTFGTADEAIASVIGGAR